MLLVEDEQTTVFEVGQVSRDVVVYEYLPLTRWRASLARLQSCDDPRVRFVLDLEDSASDIFCRELNKKVKAKARGGLIQLLQRYEGDRALYVRVNSVDSEFYVSDLEVLSTASSFEIPLIYMISKVETQEHYRRAFEDLCLLSGETVILFPLIESREGLRNLESICAHAQRSIPSQRQLEVFYGYFDMMLDMQVWPFWDVSEDEYWCVSEPIVRLCQREGFSYVQPPLDTLQPRDIVIGRALIDERLGDVSSYALSSIANGQTDSYLNGMGAEFTEKDMNLGRYPLTKLDAAELIKQFGDSQANMRSFAVIDGKFVTPHSYLAAKRWLESQEEAP